MGVLPKKGRVVDKSERGFSFQSTVVSAAMLVT